MQRYFSFFHLAKSRMVVLDTSPNIIFPFALAAMTDFFSLLTYTGIHSLRLDFSCDLHSVHYGVV